MTHGWDLESSADIARMRDLASARTLQRLANRPTHTEDGRALPQRPSEACPDAFCILAAPHDGLHDPSFGDDAPDVRTLAAEAAGIDLVAARLAAAAAAAPKRPATHAAQVEWSEAEQSSLFDETPEDGPHGAQDEA